jgi:hypothetical protein
MPKCDPSVTCGLFARPIRYYTYELPGVLGHLYETDKTSALTFSSLHDVNNLFSAFLRAFYSG